MRQIKFRGKRKDKGEWVYGDLVRNVEGAFSIVPPFQMNMNNVCSNYEVNPESVGQFTGLLDKNGKEIYEGDIIKGELMTWHTIRYNEENAAFVASFFDSPNNCCTVTQSWINEFNKTVIGNIHDTPGFLNKK